MLRPASSGGIKAISDPYDRLHKDHCYIKFNGQSYTGEVAVSCNKLFVMSSGGRVPSLGCALQSWSRFGDILLTPSLTLSS